jgi:hypothetical protein
MTKEEAFTGTIKQHEGIIYNEHPPFYGTGSLLN